MTLAEDGMSLCFRGGGAEGDGSEEIATFTKALIAAGIDYRTIETRESRLEDIFVSLVGEEA